MKRLNKQADQVEAAKAEIPARERPVIFYDTPEGRGTPERMAILNKYRDRAKVKKYQRTLKTA